MHRLNEIHVYTNIITSCLQLHGGENGCRNLPRNSGRDVMWSVGTWQQRPLWHGVEENSAPAAWPSGRWRRWMTRLCLLRRPNSWRWWFRWFSAKALATRMSSAANTSNAQGVWSKRDIVDQAGSLYPSHHLHRHESLFWRKPQFYT